MKRILKYINGTREYGMMYSHSYNSMLVGYYDAGWANNANDRKSTSGGCFFLGIILYLGSARSKNVCHCLLLRLSILQQEVVVLN